MKIPICTSRGEKLVKQNVALSLSEPEVNPYVSPLPPLPNTNSTAICFFLDF